MSVIDVMESNPVPVPVSRPRQLRELPRPRGLPLLGNLLALHPESAHSTIEGWARECGPLGVYYLGRQPVLMVSDAQLAQTVMRERPSRFRRMAALDAAFDSIIGPSLFTAQGEDLRRQRRLWTQALGARNVEGFVPVIARIGERLYQRWQRHARTATVVDVHADFMCFAFDVICSLALGRDVNTLDGQSARFHHNVQLILPRMIHRLVSPFGSWRWLNWSAERTLERGMRELRREFAEMIAVARPIAESAPEPASFLHALIAAGRDQGRPYTDDELIANAIVAAVGGNDTTAHTLAWCVHELCERPDLIRGLQEEADATLGTARVPADSASLQRLELAQAVAWEALRVRPPVPIHFLEAACDTELGGVYLPRGTAVQLVARTAAARAEGVSEPLEFRPERWSAGADAPGNRAGQFAFGGGPRVCPGRALALLEIRLALGMLARNFGWTRVGSPGDVREVDRLVMAPEGVFVQLHER